VSVYNLRRQQYNLGGREAAAIKAGFDATRFADLSVVEEAAGRLQ
jgi:hypothetical protein